MSELTGNQNERIRKAYEDYLKSIDSEDQKSKYENLTNALNEFKDRLETWKLSDNIDFIMDFALSQEASVFAADGMGRMRASGFKEFMDMKLVRENFEKMLYYKFNENDNIKKHNKIVDVDIRRILDTNEFEFAKPKLLTGRLLLMIFTELYTVIAEEKALNDACRKLDITYSSDQKYLTKQRRIRCMVDTYLKENNLYDEVSELGKASIAWWIAIG